jgi:hypothetical protein
MIKTWLHGCINRFQKKEATFTENIGVRKAGAKNTSRIILFKRAKRSAKRGKWLDKLPEYGRQSVKI